MKESDLIFGVHACKQFLENNASGVVEVFLQDGKSAERLLQQFDLEGFSLTYLDKNAMDQLASDGNHQGIILKISGAELKNEKQLNVFLDDLMSAKSAPLFLILDGITDPHNLGACLRSAAAAGVDAVILPKDKSAGINATVRKVAAGAVEILDIFVVTNLARSLDSLKAAGVWIVGTALDERATNYYQCDLKGALAIAVGSEGDGLRRLTKDKCDFLCYLPMPGNMQSLNVSVATGICLFEALRQRQG